MIASLVLTAALWPANITKSCNPGDNIAMVGLARNTTGDVLYCELITKSADHQLQVEYTNNQQVFATKQLFYGRSLAMPDVLQQDSRSGEIRQATFVDDHLLLQYQPNRHKKKISINIASNKADVVDAGFDHYMREHWDELAGGAMVPIHFASIAHQKVLPLRIRAQPLANCTGDLSEGFCFVVEIDNALLRLVLGNIKLVYDQQRRLYQFQGISNINNDKEDSQNAIIHYYYRSDYLPAPNS